MTEAEKQAYLREHLPYEILMMRYCFERIGQINDQLSWNAHYESFVLHVRSLRVFLTNKDKPNVRASDFVTGFAAKKPNELDGTLQQLNSEVMHLGRDRQSPEGRKATTKIAAQAHEWLESNLAKFFDELPPPYKAHWSPDSAKVPEMLYIDTGDSVPGASSMPDFPKK